MKPVSRCLLAAIFLVSGQSLRAQHDSAADSAALPVRVSILRPDSSFTAAGDTVHRALHPRKSPGLAMLFSAVLPGGGQFYNQSYWKVPVVLGLGLYFVSTWLDQNRRTQDYRQKYAASLYADPTDPLSSQYLTLREFYKEQRDTFGWYFVILYILNVADAYVDASLYDFDVGPDLTLRVLPVAPGPVVPLPGVTVRLSF